MIIAVIAVWMMEVSIDEIVDVIAVGNRFVTTAGSMDVSIFVAGLVVMILTAIRVGFGHRDDVLFDYSVGFLVMEVAVVEIVDVITMFECGMAAVSTVLVIMVGVDFAIGVAHNTYTKRDSRRAVKREALSAFA